MFFSVSHFRSQPWYRLNLATVLFVLSITILVANRVVDGNDDPTPERIDFREVAHLDAFGRLHFINNLLGFPLCPQLTDWVFDQAENSEDTVNRCLAVRVIGQQMVWDELMVSAVRKAAADSNDGCWAIQVFGERKVWNERVERALRQAAADVDEEVRFEACVALRSIGKQATTLVPEFEKQFYLETNDRTKSEFIRAISMVGPASEPFTVGLSELVTKSPPARVKLSASLGLWRITGSRQFLDDACRFARNPEDARLCACAVDWLDACNIDDPGVIEELMSFAQCTDASIRLQVVKAISKPKDARLEGLLVHLVRDEDEQVREEAVARIEGLKYSSPAVLASLRHCFRHGGLRARQACVYALWHIEQIDQETLEMLEELFKDTNAHVKLCSAVLLCKYRQDHGAPLHELQTLAERELDDAEDFRNVEFTADDLTILAQEFIRLPIPDHLAAPQ